MIQKWHVQLPTPKWSPFLFVSTPKSFPTNFRNRMVSLDYGLGKTVSLCHSLEFFNGINLGSIWTGFFKAFPPNRPFCVRQFNFFGQSSLYKNHECSHCFFLSFSFLPPRSFFFSFPFPSLLWFWSLSGPKNLPYFHLNDRMQISLGWFSKNSARYISDWIYVNIALVSAYICPWYQEFHPPHPGHRVIVCASP